MTVAQANSTLQAIRTKVRRLTASPNESALTTASLDEYINDFYNQDFPYAIKLDQTRHVYTLYTSPYIDRYPLNTNMNQGIRSPVYFEGIEGIFFKDRDQFFNMWPRWPTLFNPATGDGVTTIFNFTCGNVPFLSQNVVIGVISTSGTPIRVGDNGNGILQYENPDPVTGDITTTDIGTVNYVTGNFAMDFSLAGVVPGAGQLFNVWVSQYNPGRPYTIMFWNNEFTIRPVPDKVYKVELESYLTPVQFMDTTDNPTLNQWWKYIAYGAAIDILYDRQDMEGVENLMPQFKHQEGLVLERQGVEEIGQRNSTIFSSTIPQGNWNAGCGWPY